MITETTITALDGFLCGHDAIADAYLYNRMCIDVQDVHVAVSISDGVTKDAPLTRVVSHDPAVVAFMTEMVETMRSCQFRAQAA